MAVERGDSTAPVGGTSSDAPTTFEQTSLKGTTSTGNAKLVKRDATEIDVIDTNNYWSASTVEGVLDEIGQITLNPNSWGSIIGTLSNQTDLQTELDAKADKVSGATANNFASLDANGNLLDSGFKDSDYADASHTHVEADITDLGAYLENVVEDTTPQLGGNLDAQSNNLTSVGDIDATTGTIATLDGTTATFTTVDASAGSVFRKNAIINGNFDVWQRGTSFTSAATATFSADRWGYYKSGSMVHDLSQSTDVPTYAESGLKSLNSLLVDCTTADTSIAAGDYTLLRYAVEGYDYRQLDGGNATLSFWVKATKTGTYCVGLRNSGQDRSYVSEYTVNVTDTWEKKTITIPLTETGGTWDYINGVGIELVFTLAAGTTYQTTADAWQTGSYFATSNQVNACDNVANNFRIAQVQLEKWDTATPFEFRPIADEVNLCNRYFHRANDPGITGICSSATVCQRLQYQFPVPMRATPTVTPGNTGTVNLYDGTATFAITSWGTTNVSLIACDVQAVVASGLTTGRSAQLYVGQTVWLDINAEL